MFCPSARLLRIVRVVVVGVACSGCNSNQYQVAKVTGRVLCNGKPAAGGIVNFEPLDAPSKTGRPPGESGRISRGLIQDDGSFTVILEPGGGDAAAEGALIGPHRVSFTLPKSTPWEWNAGDNWIPAADQEKLKAELAQKRVYKALECSAAISPAEVEVKSGANSFDFTLQPEGGKKAPVRQQEPGGARAGSS